MNNDILIEENIPLAPMTTMRVGGPARYLIRIKNEDQIQTYTQWAKEHNLPVLVLGDGSNLVISDRGWTGLVLKMENSGIELLHESPEHVEIRVQAGVCWDNLVAHTVEKGWWGIENMSLIPGTVGACPVQNVGAYGQECKNVVTRVRAYDSVNQQWIVLENSDCNFSFRTSIFNTTQKDRYIITSVDFTLTKRPTPCLSRLSVRAQLRKDHQAGTDQAAIRKAIIALRTNGKLLPEPNTLGSAGTFFQASLIPQREAWKLLTKTFRNLGVSTACKLLACIIKYRSPAGFKVPSRFLIEACGLQGTKSGSAKLFSNNPAVLVTGEPPPPTSADILSMIQQVRNVVFCKTGLEMHVEPNLVGFQPDELTNAFSIQQ